MTASEGPSEYRICDVKLHAVQVDDAMSEVRRWLEDPRQFHYVCSSNVNNVAIALESPHYCEVMERADLSLPDGVPFLWYGRLKGHPLYKRCGMEELMTASFALSNQGAEYSHFFYGNTPEVLDDLKRALLEKYPNLAIAGMYSPPFRALTPEEDTEHIKMINDSGADFLWVSLGCPKQERWLHEHRDQLQVALGGGAGAVFNFFSGEITKAPDIIRYLGLEWFMRLALEPQRLFSRYMVRYPKFLAKFARHSIAKRLPF